MKIFNRLTRLLSGVEKGQSEIRFEEMWFLGKADDHIRSVVDDEQISDILIALRDDGVAIISGNNSKEMCDSVVSDFDDYVKENPESKDYQDQNGLHDRLCNFHMRSKAARNICFNKKTTNILRAAFDSRITVIGSLFFEKGSGQSMHRDTPAFFTNPFNHYFGIWNALEDIAHDSGPLVYYEGGHKICRDKDLYLNPDVDQENYFNIVESACIEAGLELKEIYPKKGDTIIWHPELPHGGGVIQNPKATRKSLVFHAIPISSDIYGPQEFFGTCGSVPKKQGFNLLDIDGDAMIDQGVAKFFKNRREGNFDEI